MLQPPLFILGNCCSILAGLPLALIARHDWDLRCAARLIGHTPKYASVTAHMRDTLHWLPVVPDSCSGGRCLLGSLPTRRAAGRRTLSNWIYPAVETFILLQPAKFWFLVVLQLGSVALFPLSTPPPGMDSRWRLIFTQQLSCNAYLENNRHKSFLGVQVFSNQDRCSFISQHERTALLV